MKEKLYFSLLEFGGSDAAAIQAAVDEARRTDERTVLIPDKADGTPWKLDTAIQVPGDMTVILNGCVIETEGTAFANSGADTRSLGTEQHKIFLLGRHGARIVGVETDKPQILLGNMRDCRVAGITFECGGGLQLDFVRYSKVQQLCFEGSKNGVVLTEGCCDIILENVDAVTDEEAVLIRGGDGSYFGRSTEIFNSILCRIQAVTNGVPAVALYADKVNVYNLVVRDVTDLTEGEGVSVRLGETEQEIRDITIRGVVTKRTAVETTAECDGLHCANLGSSFTARVPNTRCRLDEKQEAVALPSFEQEKGQDKFLTPNDPAFYGETDAQTIQNAVDAAAKQGVSLVIPRWNARTQSTVWNIEKAIVLPSNMTVELWGAYLRQADFCYENMFFAKDASNVTITGVGNAVLDGGLPNGLVEKNAGKYGFGPIEDNAMLRFVKVTGLKLEHFRVKQSRWYAIHLGRCVQADVGNIDFSTYTLAADLGGIYVRSGCRDVQIHELTGVVSGDLISLTALGCDEAATQEEMHIRNVAIREIKADSRRYSMVCLRNHDGRRISNVTMDTLMDVSLAEQKMSPPDGILIGSNEGYYERKAQEGELTNVTVRDYCARANKAVTFGGYSEAVTIDNVHSFSGAAYVIAVQTSAQVRGVKMSNIYFRCDQASGYMRGTATSIITDKKKYRGLPLDFTNLKGDVTVDGLLTERVSGAVRLTGGAAVSVTGLEVAEYGKFLATCDDKSQLTVNGEKISPA